MVQAWAPVQETWETESAHLELLCCGGTAHLTLDKYLGSALRGCTQKSGLLLAFVCQSPCAHGIYPTTLHLHINFSSMWTRHLPGQASLEEVFFNYAKYFKAMFEDLLHFCSDLWLWPSQRHAWLHFLQWSWLWAFVFLLISFRCVYSLITLSSCPTPALFSYSSLLGGLPCGAMEQSKSHSSVHFFL